jgi:hypothetical protein
VIPDDLSLTEWRLHLLLSERVADQTRRSIRQQGIEPKAPGRLVPGPALESEQPQAAMTPASCEPNIWLSTGMQQTIDTPEAFAFDDAGDDHDDGGAGPLITRTLLRVIQIVVHV